MANVLVTGGAGFIGANFARYWSAKHPYDQLVVLDALTYAGNAGSIGDIENILLLRGDIRDANHCKRAIEEFQIDTIVHFAAESHVDRSISGPDIFVQTNVLGTLNLLNAAKSQWIDQGSGRPHRFHHVSTDEVFGSLGLNDPAFSETTPYAPNSPYSASKASSDHLVRAYNRTYGLQTTVTNCSNNYGAYQFPEKLIPLFILNALHGFSLPIYGDGMNVRDWLHVDDHCQGIELVLARGRIGETYNIGGGAEMTNLQLIDEICRRVDTRFREDPHLAQRFPNAPAAKGVPTETLKTFVSDRPGHDRRYAINDDKLRTETGYSPQSDFAAALETTLGWYLENEAWWRSIKDGTYRSANARAGRPV